MWTNWRRLLDGSFGTATDPSLPLLVPDDLVSFTFTLLDPKRPQAQAFFVFGLQQRTYTVPIVQPALSEDTVRPLLEDLNRSRQAFRFIKEMRRLLKSEMERGSRATMTLEEAAASLTTS